MSGIDYSNPSLTKNDLQRVERAQLGGPVIQQAAAFRTPLTAEDTIPRPLALTNTVLVTRTPHINYFIASKDLTVSNISVYVTAAETGTVTARLFGIYQVTPSLDGSALVLLAQTANGTAAASAAATLTVPLLSPVILVAGQQYAVVCYGEAATTQLGLASNVTSTNEQLISPRGGLIAAQLNIGTTILPVTLTATTGNVAGAYYFVRFT